GGCTGCRGGRAAGCERGQCTEPSGPASASREAGARDASRAVRDVVDAAARDFSGDARAVVTAAIARLDDYQDTGYARHFLAGLAPLQDIERQHGGGPRAPLAG